MRELFQETTRRVSSSRRRKTLRAGFDDDFTQLSRGSRRLMDMNLEDLDLVAAAGRYPFQVNDRLAVVVLEPVPDVVIVGVFFDGELVRMIEDPIGEA